MKYLVIEANKVKITSCGRAAVSTSQDFFIIPNISVIYCSYCAAVVRTGTGNHSNVLCLCGSSHTNYVISSVNTILV